MKNCTWCGKEYPDDAIVCAIDGRELYPAAPPPMEGDASTDSVVARNRYSTFWARFCAAFIDELVFLPLSFANYSVFSMYHDLSSTAPMLATGILIGWSIFLYSAYWLYSVILHGCYGQTLGKMAMKIQVLDLSEERIPTFFQAFLRDIGYIVPNLVSLGLVIVHICQIYSGIHLYSQQLFATSWQILAYANLGWFLVEVISMMTNKKRRAVHDFIAGTVVVRKDKIVQNHT